MAFRADMVGSGAGSMPASMGLVGGQGVAGIEKSMTWKLAFFAGAAIVVTTSIFSMAHYMKDPEWAPATLFNNIFLMLIGLLMVVLDFPVPHPHGSLVIIRDNAYKFVLFLTRFMGRGIWYAFLASLVFSTLWDGEKNYIVGGIFTSYLLVLGGVAFAKGVSMSTRLNRVRMALLESNRSAEHYLAPRQTGLRKVHFQAMVESVTHEPKLFDEDELDYIINALSFTPYNDGQVSMEELGYWLSEGPMLIV